MVFDSHGFFVCGDHEGCLYTFDLHLMKCLYTLKVTQGCVNSIKLLPDGNTVASFNDAMIFIFNPAKDSSIQIIAIENGFQKIIVLSDGRIVGISYAGEISMLHFPDRYLNGKDVYLIVESLKNNKSVRLLNLPNVILDDWSISNIDELRETRPELNIIGMQQAGIYNAKSYAKH